MPTQDPRVDRYIAQAAEFARPILNHIRALVHNANKDIEETIKWNMPFFIYHGTPICHMAAFKSHCAMGFWRKEVQQEIAAKFGAREDAMGQLGRITTTTKLPSAKTFSKYVNDSVSLVDAGVPRLPAGKKKPRPEASVPPDLAGALKKDPTARRTFNHFAPSHRREYIKWVTEAKRPQTRAQRIATTLAWLNEGKSRNWKYERG